MDTNRNQIRIPRKHRTWIAMGIVISVVAGMVFSPLQAAAAEQAVHAEEADSQNTSGEQEVLAAEETDIASGEPETAVHTETGSTEEPFGSEAATGTAVLTSSPATPSAATASAVTTSPAVTSSPSPTGPPQETPHPLLTPKQKADVLLGDQEERSFVTVGTKGEFDINRTGGFFTEDQLSRLAKIRYSVYDLDILRITEAGSYEAVKIGSTSVRIAGYAWDGGTESLLFEYNYVVYVTPDMAKVTMSSDSLTLYLIKNGYYTSESSGTVKFKSDYVFDEDDDILFDVTSSNKKMDVYCHLADNKLTISCGTAGTTTLTVTMFGTEFQIKLKVLSISLSASSALMVKHTSKQLKVKGYSGTMTWKSSRPSIASVNGSGKVRAKAEGNTLISVKIGDVKMGCIVSVTTSRKNKAIHRAQSIARSSRYSQPRRMQRGYYDCSSLVWRAYSPYGYKFGASGYAPTAAGEAAYMAARGKLLKGGFNKSNVENMKIRAGDLLFKTGAKNGRYRGIYHVEMIVGYEFAGWKANGDPYVIVKWANRTDGYYPYNVGIIGRV